MQKPTAPFGVTFDEIVIIEFPGDVVKSHRFDHEDAVELDRWLGREGEILTIDDGTSTYRYSARHAYGAHLGYARNQLAACVELWQHNLGDDGMIFIGDPTNTPTVWRIMPRWLEQPMTFARLAGMLVDGTADIETVGNAYDRAEFAGDTSFELAAVYTPPTGVVLQTEKAAGFPAPRPVAGPNVAPFLTRDQD